MNIVIHTKPDCPWCEKAKAYLTEQKMPFDTTDHPDDQERQRFYDELGLVGDQRFCPQIIVSSADMSVRLAGYSELVVSGIESMLRN